MNKVIAGVAAAGAIAISLGLSAVPASANPAGKVTICHGTGSDTNPFVKITVSKNALKGHFRDGHQENEDVILEGENAVCPFEVAGPPVVPPGKGLDSDAPGIVPPPHAEPAPVVPAKPAPAVPKAPPVVPAKPAPSKVESYPAPAVEPNVPANGIPAAPLADPKAPPVVDEELAYTGAAEDELLLWGAAGIATLLLGTGAVAYSRRKI